jgi:hypothetical protein
MTEKSTVFTQKIMAERKHTFTEALKGLTVEGFALLGVTKKGVVFEEVATGAMVELTAVAKKEEFDFSEAEAEYLEALEAKAEKERVKAEKVAKAEAKKAKAE